MNGDWGITFTLTKWAILFACPHRSNELDKYEEYIIRQFTGVEVSQHSRMLNLNQAIHLHESQSNHLLLMSFSSFSDLITNHLISLQGSNPCQNLNKCTKNVIDSDTPIFRCWEHGEVYDGTHA